jgi:hypothetical protein
MGLVDTLSAWCAVQAPIGTPRPDEAPDDMWRCLTAAWEGDLERRAHAKPAHWPELTVLSRAAKRTKRTATTTRPAGA